MNATVRYRLASGQRRILARLAGEREINPPTPVFRGRNLHYEIGVRPRGLVYGGIGLFLELARQSGLVDAIDRRVQVLKCHLPYHESDHVLNLVFHALCDGRCLQDIELRRNDEAFLDALGADRIPDPTTAGDFCRRFRAEHLHGLNAAIDEARVTVWRRQPTGFFDRATLDRSAGRRSTRNRNGRC